MSDFKPYKRSLISQRTKRYNETLTSFNSDASENRKEPSLKKRKLLQEEVDILDAMNDDELRKFMNDFQEELKGLEVQNVIFELFLTDNEPELLSSYDKAKKSIEKHSAPHITFLPKNMHTISTPREKVYQYIEGPRICDKLYFDLVEREKVAIEESLKKFIQQANRAKRNIIAEIEETYIELDEVRKLKHYFDDIFVAHAVDPITHRIPAESFIGFFREWNKSQHLVVQKLRVQNNVAQIVYSNLKKKYLQKLESGECIVEVDVEVAYKLNNNLRKRMEELFQLVLTSKRTFADSNLKVAKKKEYLLHLTKSYTLMKTAINETIEYTKKLQLEYTLETERLKAAKNAFNKVKSCTSNKKVPEIMDYVRVKANLDTLKKVKKILERKNNLLDVSIKTNTILILQHKRSTRSENLRIKPMRVSADVPTQLDYEV